MNISKQDTKAIRLPYEYTETEPYEKGFSEYYQKHIVPLAAKYEEKRKRNKEKNKLNIILAITSGLAGMWLMAKSLPLRGRNSGKSLILPPIVSWWFFVRRPKRKYFTAQKEEVLPLVLKFMGDFNYKSSGYLSPPIIATHTGYYEATNIFQCEDFISYKNENVYCKIFERVFKDVSISIGKIFLYFEFAENFNIDLILTSKKMKNLYWGITIEDDLNNRLLKRREINKEPISVNHKFDQHFDLHSKNNERIIEWLTDDFIDELIYLNTVFDKEGMLLSVKDNQVFVELESQQNLFEVGTSYKEASVNAENIKKLLKELHFAISLMDMIEKRIQTLQIST